MIEHCSDGSTIWAAIPRLAAYSKLSARSTQRLVQGLCKRGVLTELAPANSSKRRPATYRFNEAALEPDPRMQRYVRRQLQLPGIKIPAIPGEPIPQKASPEGAGDMVSPGDMVSGDWCHGVRGLVTPCRGTGDMVSPNTKAFDPSVDSVIDPATAAFFLHKQGELPKLHSPPVASMGIPNRVERDRRMRLIEANKRGLRDFTKHPLEDWEKTG